MYIHILGQPPASIKHTPWVPNVRFKPPAVLPRPSPCNCRRPRGSAPGMGWSMDDLWYIRRLIIHRAGDCFRCLWRTGWTTSNDRYIHYLCMDYLLSMDNYSHIVGSLEVAIVMGIPKFAGWFISWKIRFENGWWLGVYPYVRKLPPTLTGAKRRVAGVTGMILSSFFWIIPKFPTMHR